MNTAAASASKSVFFSNSMLWIAGTALMAVFTLMTLSAAYTDGHYLPAHNDAFYHARRILDAVMTGQPVAQFDPHMHVPEGSWVTWPWAYDTVMAAITRFFGPYPDENAAMAVLAHIPVFASAFAIAAAVWAANLLRFNFIYSLLLVVGFACLPAMHAGFAIGNVDHHFAEGIWTSLALCAGIWHFREGAKLAPAIVLGLVLGTACGVHMSLFILQLPVVAFYLLQWLRGEPLPARRAMAAFAATLLVTTLAICLPSDPFRLGFFEFYTLSWFHLYIAIGTAVFVALPTLAPRRPLFIGAALVLGALAVVPLLASIDLGTSFLGGGIDTIENIMEIYSPYKIALDYSDELPAPDLLWLLWIALPATLFNLWLAWREKEMGLRFFATFACMGLVLLQLQSRLHVFGELALVATPLLAVRFAALRWPARAPAVMGAGIAVFLLLISPVRHRWNLNWRLASAEGYAQIRGVFPVLKSVCAQKPGVVLADTEAGHWVRFHSSCDVIGNLFLLTPQQAAKARQTDAMMQMTPAALVAAEPRITYVLVYHTINIDPNHEIDLEQFRPRMSRIETALLGPAAEIPAQYGMVWELRTPAGQTYARLFEIGR